MPEEPTPQEKLEQEVKAAAPADQFKPIPVINRLTKSQVNKLAKAILEFSVLLSGVALYPYQREFGLRVILSVLFEDAEEITALFSRQSGKTETIAVVVNGLMVMLPILAKYIKDKRLKKFEKGFWVGIFAPAHDQADTTHNRMNDRLHSAHAVKILADDEIGIEIDANDKRYTRSLFLPSGSFARCHSAAKQAKIESKTYHLLIIEEAQDVDPFIMRKSISPMGASTAATTVKIGTCNMQRSDFYDACQRNARKDTTNKMRCHFQFDYEVACKYNPLYKKTIRKELEKPGAFDSDEFRLAYRLHWLLERGMLVEATHFETLGHNYYVTTFDANNAVVAGIDVAKVLNSTVVTVIQPDYTRGIQMGQDDFRCFKRVVNWLELQGDKYPDQLTLIVDFFKNFKKLIRIHIDATGVGQALYDLLCQHYAEEIEAGRLQVIPFTASTQSNHEGFLRLLNDLQGSRMVYPASDKAKKLQKQRKFVQQLTNIRKAFRGAYLAIEAGDETPRTDYASSLMMGCWGCDLTGLMTEIQEDDNFLMSPVSAGQTGRYQDRGREHARPWWRNK